MKILLFISSLTSGGAERQLVNLARGLAQLGDEVTLVTLYDRGELRSLIQRSTVKYISLNQSAPIALPISILKLSFLVRKVRPAIVYSLLGGPNVLAAVASMLWGGTPLVWGIRSGELKFKDFPWSEFFTFRIGAILSRFPKLIIFNSFAGMKFYQSQGYREWGMAVVHNGIETEQFNFDEAGRWRVRAEWGVGIDEPLFGMVARIDPLKDHYTFIRAAKEIEKDFPKAKFVIVGSGSEERIQKLKEEIAKLSMQGKFIWAGQRQDLSSVYSALDLHILSSFSGEGFPNVLAESMACGIPTITFDVGDSAHVLINKDFLISERTPGALAAVAKKVLLQARSIEFQRALRQRIVARFSIEKLASETRLLFSRVVGGKSESKH